MRRLALFVFAILAAQPALGHHSTSAIFHDDKRITVSGTLTKVDWINPHIQILLDAGSGAQSEPWRIQGNPPQWWRNLGVGRADFAKGIGQKVTVVALPAQDGSHYGYLRKITFANGDVLEDARGEGVR
ncbi:MAG: hypothetical protein HYU37_15100 [Acidobacteria bacterium]|nr:hypothetical protein [Acidobacteriota bacterium]